MREQETPMTILLVEDEALIAVMEKETLKRHGFNVILASSGEKAVNIAQTTPDVDLILMDINLGKGKMDGTEAADIILKENDIPILFLSSYTQPEVVEKTERITSYGYVVKDSGETVLIASIKMAFKFHEANRQVKNRERALKESEEKYRMLIDTSNEGIWMMNGDHETTYVNHAMACMMGYDPTEMQGKKVEDFFFPEDIEFHTKKMQKRHAGEDEVYERRFRHKDGSELWTLTSAKALKDGQDRFIGSFAMFTDITERKLSEKLLKESEERLRLAHKATNDVIWDWDIIHDTQRWNEAGTVVFGWTEIVEGPVDAHWWVERVHPDDRQRVDEKFFAAVNDPEADRWNDEYRFLKTDGRYAEVMDRGYILRNAQGKAVRMIGSMLDITSRKRAEEEVKQSERTLKAFVDATSDAVFAIDKNGTYLVMNEITAARLNKSISALVGTSAYDLSDTYLAQKRRAMVNEVFTSGKPIIFLDERDGLWLENRLYPIFDADDKVEMVVVYSRDITERKLAEEQIKSLLSEKELLLREVHHRIKNNMATMMGLLLMQANSQEDSSVAAALKDAANRLKSMSVLYDKLYRSENPREMPAQNYLTPLVHEIVRTFSTNITVKTETAIDDFIISVESLAPLGIIINELITNSMKYAFHGKNDGLISISATKKDSHVTIIIADNGIGIPDSIDLENSSGFGLQLVRMLTEQIDGVIKIERSKGTKFVLEFEV